MSISKRTKKIYCSSVICDFFNLFAVYYRIVKLFMTLNTVYYILSAFPHYSH